MHRVGASPERPRARWRDLVDAASSLTSRRVWTHCAVADDPDRPLHGDAARPIRRGASRCSRRVVARRSLRHAANSAGGLAHRARPLRHGASRHRDVRHRAVSPTCALPAGVAPALTLRSEVTHVQTVDAGEGVSYGHRWFAAATTHASPPCPIGYADGVRRDLSGRRRQVLIRGRRRPIVGVVTMDQLMVDCGDLPRRGRRRGRADRRAGRRAHHRRRGRRPARHDRLRGRLRHRRAGAAALPERTVIDFGLPGLRAGHWTDDVARTGCTVLLFPEGTVASGEVRGGAPATRVSSRCSTRRARLRGSTPSC